MKSSKQLIAPVLCLLALLLPGPFLNAQTPSVRSRVVDAVDETRTVRTQGNIHPLARMEFDRGALGDSQPLTRVLLLLQRSDEQKTALHQLIEDQQATGSGNFHKWLTPEQFGAKFGPSDSDIQAVTDWLTRQGFEVAKVSAGRTTIEFSGTVGQVRSAFQTEMHQFSAYGKEFVANTSEPAIPAALAPVVKGVVALHNYPKESHARTSGQYLRENSTGAIRPFFTYNSNPPNFALGPGDWKTIYNVPSKATGAHQSIAIVGQSNINLQDIRDFRTIFGLQANDPEIRVNGPDPGLVSGDEAESDLDVEWAGAIAPAAHIILVVSQSTISNSNTTQISGGVDLSALYIVDNNLAPVLSESYGTCEPLLGTTGNQFYSNLWEQAAAQGITVVVSSGDNGSAGCDPSPGVNGHAASQGPAVNGVASTPFNVAVGGTDFDPSTTTPNTTYWNTTSGTVNSALKYMPEITWDDSACAGTFPAACTSVDTTSYNADISAASGGPSNCMTSTTTACTAGYPKPSFQNGVTFSDSARDVPDISFFASNGGPITGGSNLFLIVCQADVTSGNSCSLNPPFTSFQGVGGTSAATPTFAAVMSLVNQTQVTAQNPDGRQGNANYVLYALAAKDNNYTSGNCNSSLGHTPAAGCTFNDVTKGNNGVACVQGSKSLIDGKTTWCQGSGTIFGVTISNGSVAYGSAAKYDLATGLGSINVANLLANWTSGTRTPTTTTLTNPSGGTPSGRKFTASVSVSPAPTTGTQDVSLIALASDKTSVLGSYGPFPLSSGSVNLSTPFLPPDTAYVAAGYSGDATHSPSTSAPVALAGTVAGSAQASTLKVYYVGFDSNGNPTTPTTSAQNFVYGSGNGYILKIEVSGPAGTCAFSVPNTQPAFPCPTGTITLLNNGHPLTDFLNNGVATATASLNNQGFAEDQPINVSVGTNNITATYSGDKNYAANNSSNQLVITVTQASTTTSVASSLSTIPAGAMVQLTATIGTTSGGEAPCGITNGGTVAFSNNGTPLTGTVSYTAIPATPTTPAGCTASLTAAISSIYPSPMKQPRVPAIPMVLLALSLAVFLALFRGMPENRRRVYAYAGLVAFAIFASVVAGCGGGGGGGGGGVGGSGGSTRTITAVYSGDTNYSTSRGTKAITIQ